MGVVIFPAGWEQLPDSQRNAIVPICIADVDRHGNTIAAVWFEEGVAPIQARLRKLAHYRLGDVRRVSELAEVTVHKLWATHGPNAGASPAAQVWERAKWEARDLAAGDSQWRIKHTVSLALGSMENDLFNNGLPDPIDYSDVFERRLLVDMIERKLVEAGREDFLLVFRMLQERYSWEEIAFRLNEPKVEALKKRFWRWIKRNIRKK